ncbi:hypothetical protein TNCV_1765361 [Trichonephila clavipes]|nr:hypothetical protein TNCV_1765361 [Trichonephila clavipes]
MPRIQLNSRAVPAFYVGSRAVGHDLHTSHVPRPHYTDGSGDNAIKIKSGRHHFFRGLSQSRCFATAFTSRQVVLMGGELIVIEEYHCHIRLDFYLLVHGRYFISLLPPTRKPVKAFPYPSSVDALSRGPPRV